MNAKAKLGAELVALALSAKVPPPAEEANPDLGASETNKPCPKERDEGARGE